MSIGVGALVAGTGALFLFEKVDHEVLPPTVAAPKTEVSGAEFAQESEAERYREAKTSGSQNAIAVLEEALEFAREQSEPNDAVISLLEERLAEKRLALELAQR